MLIQLFKTFFKIGALTIGGGYAMLPVIQREVVDNKNWLTKDEFIDSIAVTNSLPGPLATNCATFVGYKVAGIPGAVTALLGAVIPSFLIIVAIAVFFTAFAEHRITQYIFSGIRPAVVAIIFFAIVKLVKSVGINKVNVLISVTASLLILVANLHPVAVIVIFAVTGVLFLRREAESK